MENDLIQKAYGIFSKYYLNDYITGCNCDMCITEDYNQFLHKIPLHELTGQDLVHYVECVDTIDEKCNDFKYFFPRILEIIYNDSKIHDDSFFCVFVWNKLSEINFVNWPDNEKEITIEFFKNYWNETKQEEDSELVNPTIEDIKKQVFQRLSI